MMMPWNASQKKRRYIMSNSNINWVIQPKGGGTIKPAVRSCACGDRLVLQEEIEKGMCIICLWFTEASEDEGPDSR